MSWWKRAGSGSGLGGQGRNRWKEAGQEILASVGMAETP